MKRDDLVRYLDRYLEASKGEDFGPNGLQVEGRPEVEKIVTGVTACRELFERAAQAGADAVLVHHGIFLYGAPYEIKGVQHGRVSALLRSDLNLLAYHLPLDRHPELGNNALSADALGLSNLRPFGYYKGLPVGLGGDFDPPVSAETLVSRIRETFDHDVLIQGAGPDSVSSLALVTGGAPREIFQAIDQGYDAYLTGEVSEYVMNIAREAGVHYFAAGHYATERCGVQALGEHLAVEFGLEVEFIDIPNPV